MPGAESYLLKVLRVWDSPRCHHSAHPPGAPAECSETPRAAPGSGDARASAGSQAAGRAGRAGQAARAGGPAGTRAASCHLGLSASPEPRRGGHFLTRPLIRLFYRGEPERLRPTEPVACRTGTGCGERDAAARGEAIGRVPRAHRAPPRRSSLSSSPGGKRPSPTPVPPVLKRTCSSGDGRGPSPPRGCPYLSPG